MIPGVRDKSMTREEQIKASVDTMKTVLRHRRRARDHPRSRATLSSTMFEVVSRFSSSSFEDGHLLCKLTNRKSCKLLADFLSTKVKLATVPSSLKMPKRPGIRLATFNTEPHQVVKSRVPVSSIMLLSQSGSARKASPALSAWSTVRARRVRKASMRSWLPIVRLTRNCRSLTFIIADLVYFEGWHFLFHHVSAFIPLALMATLVFSVPANNPPLIRQTTAVVKDVRIPKEHALVFALCFSHSYVDFRKR